MSDFHYDASRTGLLLVDPYNDFLSEGGKLWTGSLSSAWAACPIAVSPHCLDCRLGRAAPFLDNLFEQDDAEPHRDT